MWYGSSGATQVEWARRRVVNHFLLFRRLGAYGDLFKVPRCFSHMESRRNGGHVNIQAAF
jgi:hypothetical protein